MTIERAQELQKNIAKEAVAMLVIHGEGIDVRQHEQSVTLVGEAWNVSAEDTERQLELIQREKDAILNGTDDVLPEAELPMNATGTETLDNIWGLFEIAVRLHSEDKRMELYNIARELEECQNLLDWIEKSPAEPRGTAKPPFSDVTPGFDF